jgi:hypothetical protein
MCPTPDLCSLPVEKYLGDASKMVTDFQLGDPSMLLCMLFGSVHANTAV